MFYFSNFQLEISNTINKKLYANNNGEKLENYIYINNSDRKWKSLLSIFL